MQNGLLDSNSHGHLFARAVNLVEIEILFPLFAVGRISVKSARSDQRIDQAKNGA